VPAQKEAQQSAESQHAAFAARTAPAKPSAISQQNHYVRFFKGEKS
jgi:hypothetical protein